MADTVLFEGFEEFTYVSFSSGAGADPGITPDLEDPLSYPPPWQGGPPDLLYEQFTLIGGSGSPTTPPGSPLTGHDGTPIWGFYDVLYFRIHVIPVVYYLGNVLQPEVRVVEVWNAWPRDSKTLSQIVETGTTGIVLIEPGSTPLLYVQLSSKDYTLEISDEGPAVIEANYVFDFTSEAPELDIYGQRSIAFAFCPQRPIKEMLEWRTDILESYDGDEHRIRGRRLPRQLFEYDYLIPDPEARRWALNTIAGQHGYAFGVPVFPMMRPLTADISAGVTVIPVDTTYADFRESSTFTSELVMLWRDWDDYEVVQVIAGGVAPSSLTVERPTIGGHTAGDTFAIPLQIMYSNDPIEWEESPNNVLFLKVGWLSTEVADIGDVSGLPTLDGLPVLAGYNFIDRRLGEKVTRNYTLIDPESGVFDVKFGRTVTEIASVKGFEARTAEDCWTMREIICGLNGRQTSFFLPSYRNDFTLASPIGSSATQIHVETVGFDRFLAGAPPWDAIMIELYDGTQFFRQITLTEPGSGDEVITIDSSLGQLVNQSDIRFFSIMYRMRFNVDRVEIEHKHVGEMSSRIPVAGVKQ